MTLQIASWKKPMGGRHCLLGPWRTLVLEGTVSHDEGPSDTSMFAPHLSFVSGSGLLTVEFRSGTDGFRVWFWGEDCDFFLAVLSLSCSTQDLFIVCAGLGPLASGILVPQPGVESALPALEARGFPTTGPSGSPSDLFLKKLFQLLTLFKITVIY